VQTPEPTRHERAWGEFNNFPNYAPLRSKDPYAKNLKVFLKEKHRTSIVINKHLDG